VFWDISQLSVKRTPCARFNVCGLFRPYPLTNWWLIVQQLQSFAVSFLLVFILSATSVKCNSSIFEH